MIFQHFLHINVLGRIFDLKKIKDQPTTIIWIKLEDCVYPILYTKIQPESFLGSGEEDFYAFLPYMGMLAILFNGTEPIKQIVNILSIEGLMWNLLKIVQVVSKKTFKNYTILYMDVVQEKGQIAPRRQIFYCK